MHDRVPSRRLLASTALVCLGLTAGCPPPRPTSVPGPAEIVRAFEGARSAGRSGAAWLLPGADPARLPSGGRAPGGPENLDARGAAARELRRELRWALGEEAITVVSQAGSPPRVRLPRLIALAAPTPQAAVALLAEALNARDYAALLALLPKEEAARWSEARLAAVLSGERWTHLAAVARALTDGVTVTPSGPASGAAQARTESGEITVSLVREAGGWKVADLRPHEVVLGGP